ncbi:MAG TPA: hypothetical protein VHW23_04885 [Kofleriaceae bacterium]|nr:hypothetical protein [Kofleriaceae bacterium]
MTQDSLTAQLVEVARQVVDETPGQQFATARRIHETLAREQRTRKHRIQVIALAFAGICALAVVARYAGWQPGLLPDEAPVVVSAPPARAPGPSPVAPRAPVAPEPPAPALSPTPAPVPAPVVVPAPAPARSPAPSPVPARPVPAKRPAVPAPVRPEALRAEPAPSAPATEPAPSAPAAEPVHPANSGTDASEELKSYSRAHDAYFHGADPAAALAAWDAYLTSYPGGQLVLEARYARALVLIKLERWSEAAAALRPFASAPAGSYRQAEAARLLAAMPGH